MAELDKNAAIPVVDIFAGPGGLSEGFSSVRNSLGLPAFDVKLSIEKDKFAHLTLELRAFFRQFEYGEAPDLYYSYCRGEVTRNELFKAFPNEASAAREEAWQAELGKTAKTAVHRRIANVIGDSEDWVLIGGPPCQAYSTVGRSRMRGANPNAFEEDERHFLYQEYLEILRQHSPTVFVMENVRGLLSSRVQGRKIFTKILNDLRTPLPGEKHGYRIFSIVVDSYGRPLEPTDYLVRAEEFGVPQRRHRVILVGIREDKRIELPRLEKQKYTPSVADAIQDLPPLRSGLSREKDSHRAWRSHLEGFRSVDWGVYDKDERLLERIEKAVDQAQIEQVGSDRYYAPSGSWKRAYSGWLGTSGYWFLDPKLGRGVLNHQARSHMGTDLLRYLFSASYAETYGTSPRLRDFPESLLPKHKNVHKAMASDYFADRFRVQLSSDPATTIVSHLAKDGHYFIHPDPSQCRSLTVREAARLQTFPDNYFFEGPRTEQYRQVGNAVPPLLAYQIAKNLYTAIVDT
ncbi:MAG: DNA cytosine methyltransferase [Trueperaceae bacterium]